MQACWQLSNPQACDIKALSRRGQNQHKLLSDQDQRGMAWLT